MCLASHNTDCSILMNLSDNIHYQYVPLYSYNYVLSYCSRDSVYNDIMGSQAVLTMVSCVTCAPQTQVCMFSDSSSVFEHTQNYYVYPHTTKVYMYTHSIVVYVHTQLNCLCAHTTQLFMCTHSSTVYVHTQLNCLCAHTAQV